MVHWFGTFGATAPWVYDLIFFGIFTIVAVHVYRSSRKRRARAKARASAEGIVGRPILPVDVCTWRVGDNCTWEHPRNTDLGGPCGFDGNPFNMVDCEGYAPVVPLCRQEACPMFDEREPASCPTRIRRQCRAAMPDLHA